MGASLQTPAVCPLCSQLVRDPVVLKCSHRFCRRCIGDLWSGSVSGPYSCPEWKCGAVYASLPFGGSSAAVTSGSHGASSHWRKPSLTKRLLGKRKFSLSAEQQPETKRPAMDPPSAHEPSNEHETPSTSGQLKKEETAESSHSGGGDNILPMSSNSDIILISSVSEEGYNRQNKPGPHEVLILEDSSGSSDVDTCDALSPETPATEKSGSPPCSDRRGNPPFPRVSWPSPLFTKHLGTKPPSPPYSSSSPAKLESDRSGPVPCHYCPSPGQQPAVKTCLVCGASMCTEHLRPHLDSPVFQNHALVAPIDDLGSWRCQEHQEMNRIYCRQCAVCVCTVCTVIGSHRDHTCISIREAERELRGNLKEEIKHLQQSEQSLLNRVTDFTQRKQELQAVLDEARSAVQQQYTAMRETLEQEEQSALQCVTHEQDRSLGALQGHIGHLQSSLASIQQGLHMLEKLADTKGDKRVQEQAFITEYSKITQMFSQMGTFIVELQTPEEVNRARLKCLQRWTEKRLDTLVISLPDRDPYRLLYGTIPSLDADTAHPKLLLSNDNRRVSYSEVPQACAEQGARFSSFPQVLGSQALERGRCYWEVDVSSDEGRWKVGLCEAQIGRKGQKDDCRLGFNLFSWCLGSEKGKVEAVHNKVAAPVATERLRRIGVFLDFDEGLLSFFAVTPGGSLVLLHSYRHRFVEPLHPALYASKTQLSICDLFQLND